VKRAADDILTEIEPLLKEAGKKAAAGLQKHAHETFFHTQKWNVQNLNTNSTDGVQVKIDGKEHPRTRNPTMSRGHQHRNLNALTVQRQKAIKIGMASESDVVMFNPNGNNPLLGGSKNTEIVMLRGPNKGQVYVYQNEESDLRADAQQLHDCGFTILFYSEFRANTHTGVGSSSFRDAVQALSSKTTMSSTSDSGDDEYYHGELNEKDESEISKVDAAIRLLTPLQVFGTQVDHKLGVGSSTGHAKVAFKEAIKRFGLSVQDTMDLLKQTGDMANAENDQQQTLT
jgi:hypothetical protein